MGPEHKSFPAPPPGWEYESLMRAAIKQAGRAESAGEVPVGAVLVAADGGLLAQAANSPITLHDPSAHAEMLCLRMAGERVGNYRLPGSVLAVTLEPCLMCLGAIVHARVETLVIGASDPKTGAIYSRLNGPGLDFLNHSFSVVSGVLDDECATLLKDFFRRRRLDAQGQKVNAP